MYIANLEKERQEILRGYKDILIVITPRCKNDQLKQVRKAFTLAANAHKDMRRRSGEPYIFHPIEVAKIVACDIGLGPVGVICALLHDVVEDTDYTIEDIRDIFGEQIAKIIEGLTKIEDILLEAETSVQVENFKKILLSMAEDVRVILVKLADRLHNMRTLDSMPEEKQLKIASETAFFYAPIAHRLGLYTIKSELEDLSMRYTDPIAYNTIARKLKTTEKDRNQLIEQFTAPIIARLDAEGYKYEITHRIKSVFSIYQKMKKKNIGFEDVYDIFAIRIILDVDAKNEKAYCFNIYSIVTELYQPNPERFRDWISAAKANGYQSLHTTVMSNAGKWIEVQIRSKRMDEIAERGFAAHWKYKQEEDYQTEEYETHVEEWLQKIRIVLKNAGENAGDFLTEIKLNLDLKEIYVFTPKGEMRTLPINSSVLDFAYDIHTKIGDQCIGAKVNHNIVPISYKLKTGDQIEIITSRKQTCHETWLNMVITPKAKEAIKETLKKQQKDQVDKGKEILNEYLKEINKENTPNNLARILEFTNTKSTHELYFAIANSQIACETIKRCFSNQKTKKKFWKSFNPFRSSSSDKNMDQIIQEQLKSNPEIMMLDDSVKKIEYKIAPCCNPIPGDQVIGFIISKNNIVVHRTSCKEAQKMMSQYGNRIVKAKWKTNEQITFLAGIAFKGFDTKGLVKEVMDIITGEYHLNIRSINFESSEGLFTGKIIFYIMNVDTLEDILQKLTKIEGIEQIERINSDIN